MTDKERALSKGERRELARRGLIDAAKSLIAERRLEGVTLAAVGERAGFSRALADHYFGSREGLLSAAVDELLAGPKEPDKPGLTGLLAAISNTLKSDLETRRALVVVLGSATSNPDLASKVSTYCGKAIARLEQHLRAGIDAGEIRPDVSPALEAFSIFALLWGSRAMMLTGVEVDQGGLAGDVVEGCRRRLAAVKPPEPAT